MTNPNSESPNLTDNICEFIEELNKQNMPPLYTLSPEDARNALRDLQAKTHKTIDADVQDMIIHIENFGDLDVRIVRPENNNNTLPVILYIHGGGWVLGDKDTHDELIRRLANNTDSVVIFPSYPLSPEAQYPVAINQIYELLKYIHKNSHEFNIDPNNIKIAGDSVGGNMAAAIVLKSKKENGPKIRFLAMFYPVTNADMDSKSYEAFEYGPWLTKKAMEWFWDAYLPDKSKKDEIYVSPLKASLEDLKDFPNTLVLTVENDVLRDEGEAFARKLDSAGVQVLNVRVNCAIHDFMMLNALSDNSPAKDAVTLSSYMIGNNCE